MDIAVLLLLVLNFIFYVTLPRVFFKKDGALTLKWWLTAAPIGICPVALLTFAVTHHHPWMILPGSATIALAFSTVSIALLSFTLGTHRIPISLWHQENDAPQHIVTYGAYSRIRHPLYTSLLFAFLSAFVFFPDWVTFICLAYMAFELNRTAAKEETMLSHSEFSEEYLAFMSRTGRFVPRLKTQPTGNDQVAV